MQSLILERSNRNNDVFSYIHITHKTRQSVKIIFSFVWAAIKSSNQQVKYNTLETSQLGTMFFLICIHDLSIALKSNPKLFANGYLQFSALKDINLSQIELSEDLAIINNCACLRKMSFSPDPSKQAQEVTNHFICL